MCIKRQQYGGFSAYKFYRGEESNPFRRGTLRHGIWEWEKRCEEIFTSDEDTSFAWFIYCKEVLKDEKIFWDELSKYFDEENMVRFCANKAEVVKWFMNRNYPKKAIPYLKQTRLYKGEPEDCKPYANSDLELFYFYELKWVQFNVEGDSLEGELREYLSLVGKDFEANDGVPITMKAILLNRYLHWVGGYHPINEEVEFFKDWYVNSIYHRRNYIKWKKEQNQIGE